MALRSLTSRYGDQLLAAFLAALYGVEVVFSGEVAGHRGAGATVAVLMATSLVVRRTMPVLPLVAAVAVVQLNHTVLPGLAEGGAFMLCLIIADYSAGCHASGRTLWLSGLLVAGLIPLAAFDPRQPPQFGDFTFFVVFLGGPFVAGRIIRHRRLREAELAGRAAALEADRDARARAAVAEERSRIARELHDVVSHAISVIVLQSRGGRRVLGEGRNDLRQVLDAIEGAGEQALDDMRRLLALLRDDEEGAVLSPQPGLRRIEDLAAQLTAAGLPAQVTREGVQVELPAGIELSAYRIVQEALTNTLKHADAAHASVVLRYRPDELEVEVLDDGTGAGPGGGTGRGLAGIRERVAVYGGELEAGHRPEGGYALRARLPLGSPR